MIKFTQNIINDTNQFQSIKGKIMSGFSTFKACLGKSCGASVLTNNDLSWLIQDYLESPKKSFQDKLVKSQNIFMGSIDIWSKKIMNLITNTRDRFVFDSPEYQLWDARYESENVFIVLNQPTMNTSGKLVQYCVSWSADNIEYMHKLYYTFYYINKRSNEPEIDRAELTSYQNDIGRIISNEMWVYISNVHTYM